MAKSWLTSVLSIVIAGLCIVGCEKKQPDRGFANPSGPEWTFDQPFYVVSPDAPAGLVDLEADPTDVYVARHQLIIPRPKVNDPRKAPRTAIWATYDHGVNWEKLGYYGLQQEEFFYPVDKDAEIGIRFIGPKIAPAKCKPPKPHMIYHVDTTSPKITVFLSPNKEAYVPGDQITVEWQATDLNFKPESVKLGVCIDSEDTKFKWAFIGKVHPRVGREVIEIPTTAVHKTMKIRVTAEDLAGNVGIGYSCPIVVVLEAVPDDVASTQPASATQPTTQPAKSGAQVYIQNKEAPQILTTMPAADITDDLEKDAAK